MSKFAKVRISIEVLGTFLRAEAMWNKRVETNAPKDLKVICLAPIEGTINGLTNGTVFVVCESDTFPENIEGADIPEVEPFVYTIL